MNKEDMETVIGGLLLGLGIVALIRFSFGYPVDDHYHYDPVLSLAGFFGVAFGIILIGDAFKGIREKKRKGG